MYWAKPSDHASQPLPHVAFIEAGDLSNCLLVEDMR